MSIQIKLGDRVFASSDNFREVDWEGIHHRNQVYTGALAVNGIDKAQFEYDPDKKWFKFGSLIERQTSATEQGQENLYNVYLKPYIVTQDNIVVDSGSGGGVIQNPSTGEGGETSGIQTLVGGTGITIDFSTLGNTSPIISADFNTVASVDSINAINARIDGLELGGSGGSGESGGTGVNLNNPDYAALLELLNVMEVHYEDEPVGTVYNLTGDDVTANIHLTTGTRFVWLDPDTSVNCIRFKNYNTGGDRGDYKIFLKVVECPILDGLTQQPDYAPVGKPIMTVSSNSINQKENNTKDEWYEWYFPKNIQLKNNTTYSIIPHLDKTFSTVTATTAKVVFFGTTDVNTSTIYTGFWTGERTENINIQQTPILQFCNKIPTTILMKQ